MNCWLVTTLSMINVLAALCIIMAGSIVGQVSYGDVGGIMGGVVGFLVASVVCGGLAAVLLIEKHLRVLAYGRPTRKARKDDLPYPKDIFISRE